MVSVVGLPYGGVRVPLTNDHVRARHVIERASGQRANAETGSQMACRTRLVLESLEHLLRSMAGRTSPTTVVLLTAGLASPRRDAPMALAPGMCELQADLFKRVGAAAGVADFARGAVGGGGSDRGQVGARVGSRLPSSFVGVDFG